MATVPVIVQRQKEVEELLGQNGRLLLRYSGTESLCRVMIEAEDKELCNRLCDEFAELIESELGA